MIKCSTLDMRFIPLILCIPVKKIWLKIGTNQEK